MKLSAQAQNVTINANRPTVMTRARVFQVQGLWSLSIFYEHVTTVDLR